jgi:hypothetical protein
MGNVKSVNHQIGHRESYRISSSSIIFIIINKSTSIQLTLLVWKSRNVIWIKELYLFIFLWTVYLSPTRQGCIFYYLVPWDYEDLILTHITAFYHDIVWEPKVVFLILSFLLGKPSPQIEWRVGDERMSFNEPTYRIENGEYHTKQLREVTVRREHHGANLTCLAFNSNLTDPITETLRLSLYRKSTPSLFDVLSFMAPFYLIFPFHFILKT